MKSAPAKRPSIPAPAAPSPDAALREEVRVLTHQVRALLTIVEPMVTRRVPVAKQAALAGCSRVTLWRRRQRAKLQVALAR